MTLAVAGFLIGNLAIKDPFAYKLLFEKSRLFPILYLALATLASLILISLLRDNFSEPSDYNKLVISGSYMAIIVISLVAILFRTIITFTNNKSIHELFESDLLLKAKKEIRSLLIIELSKIEVAELMDKYNARKRTFFDSFELDLAEKEAPPTDNAPSDQVDIDDMFNGVFVVDINIARLEKFLKTKSTLGTVVYEDIHISSFLQNTVDYIRCENRRNTQDDRSELRRILVTRPKQGTEERMKSVRGYFDDKIEEFVKDGRAKSLDSILDSYLKLYNLEIYGR